MGGKQLIILILFFGRKIHTVIWWYSFLNKTKRVGYWITLDCDHCKYVHGRGRYGGVQSQVEEEWRRSR